MSICIRLGYNVYNRIYDESYMGRWACLRSETLELLLLIFWWKYPLCWLDIQSQRRLGGCINMPLKFKFNLARQSPSFTMKRLLLQYKPINYEPSKTTTELFPPAICLLFIRLLHTSWENWATWCKIFICRMSVKFILSS